MYICAVTKRYSIAEARAGLSTLVDEVEAGHDVELTRRGKSVAVVISRGTYERLRADRPRFSQTYAAFRARFDLQAVGTDGDALADLRDRSPGRPVAL